MGIPGFFRDLDKYHPECLLPKPITTIDVLAWDFNGVLYNSYAQLSKIHSPEHKNFQTKMIQFILKEIQKIIKLYPTQLLYLAMDGVAPEQKMIEQRLRRSTRAITEQWFPFLEEHTSKKLYVPSIKQETKPKFSTFEFTPGSAFYDVFHKALLKFLPTLPVSEIYYDSPFTPGEAEQKILKWIQLQPNKNQTFYIISKDADLLVLPFSLRPRTIYILRELEQRNEKTYLERWGSENPLPLFITIDLPKLYDFYIEDIQKKVKNNNFFTKEVLFRDQEILTFFLGNDFIKPIYFLPSTTISKSNVILQDAYLQTMDEIRLPLVQYDKRKKKWGFLLRPFIRFMGLLADQECHLIGQYASDLLQKGKHKRIQPETPTFDEWFTHLDFANTDHPWSKMMIPFLQKLKVFQNQNRRLTPNEWIQLHQWIHPSNPEISSPESYIACLTYNLLYYMNHDPPSWRGSIEQPISPFPSQIVRWIMSKLTFHPDEQYLHDILDLEKVWTNWGKLPYTHNENYNLVLPTEKERILFKPKDILKPPCDIGTAGKWEHKTLLFHLAPWNITNRLQKNTKKRNQILPFHFLH